MQIDEAIEIKSREGEEFLHTDPGEIDEADRLSVEALKRVKACRHEYGCPLIDPEGRPEDIIAAQLLPGETED